MDKMNQCPCCGRAVEPLELFVFSNGNIASYNGDAVHLPTMQTALLRCLARAWPHSLTSDALVSQLYAAREPEHAIKLIHVYVHHLRKSIAKLGIQILHTDHAGYRIVLPHQAQIARTSVQRRKIAA